MQHGIQPSDQRGAVKKSAMASKSDVMIEIEMYGLNAGRSATFGSPVTTTVDWKLRW
jgi:hypothetical protein